MRTLTMNGYLETRVRELGGNTVSLPRLVRRASESPRLWGYLLLWSAASGRSDRLSRLMGDGWAKRDELDELVRLAGEGLLDTWSPVAGLGNDVLGAWRDWLTARDAPLRERQEKAELRERILALEPAADTHRYSLGRELGLNPGNLYSFLDRGELRTLTAETVRTLLSALERGESGILDRIVCLAEGQRESDVPELVSLILPLGLGRPERVVSLLRSRGSRTPLGNGGVGRWLERYALESRDGQWHARTRAGVRQGSLDDVSGRIASGGKGFMNVFVAVQDFAMDFGSSSTEDRSRILMTEPHLTGEPFADAFVAGLAELLADDGGLSVPVWVQTEERYLDGTPVVVVEDRLGTGVDYAPEWERHGILATRDLAFKD